MSDEFLNEQTDYIEAMAMRQGWKDALEGKMACPQAKALFPEISPSNQRLYNAAYAEAYEFEKSRQNDLVAARVSNSNHLGKDTVPHPDKSDAHER